MSGGLSDRKKAMRRQCFSALKALSVQEKEAASAEICQQVADLDAFQSADTIFAFLPLPSEPDLRSLFDESRTWGFPRVLADDKMEFRKVSDLSQCREGKYKISEPDPEVCSLLEPLGAEILLIPGVGFQKETGDRLGRGKGHYDRFLQVCLNQENPPLLLGICFSVQLCDVPAESHDIPMDLVISG